MFGFSTISYKPTTYRTAKYIHKKCYWTVQSKIVFWLSFLLFLQAFFLLFQIF